MRPSLCHIVLSTLALMTAFSPTAASAAPPYTADVTVTTANLSLAAAERHLEMAQLKLRLYQRVEYPLQMRKLKSEIELTKARIASQKRRVTEFEKFTKFKYSSPVFTTLENTRLTQLELELRLKELKEEKMLLTRHYGDYCRLLQLQVGAAKAQVEALRQ